MKNMGKILKILGVLLIIALPIAVAWSISLSTNKNSNQNLSIAEARELVDKACIACGINENTVTTASLNTQSDTENTADDYDLNMSSVKQLLAISKLLVAQNNGNEGFYKTTHSTIPGTDGSYYACRIKDKGVEIDWVKANSESMIGMKMGIRVYYVDNHKKNWEIICFNGEANGELKNIDDRECNNYYVCPAKVRGVDDRLLSLSWVETEFNQSVYRTDLNIDSIKSCVCEERDYVDQENNYAKVYGDYESRTFKYSVQNLTNEELDQIIQLCHEIAVNFYSPKFYGVECKEYDVIKDMSNLLGY